MCMSFTERTQVLLTPEQRRRVERMSRHQGRSVAAVIRDAIDLFVAPATQDDALETIFELDLPVSDWPAMKSEIIEAASS